MKRLKIFYYLLVILIALIIWFAPALLIVGIDKATCAMSRIVYYTSSYDIDIESHEPFKNLTIIVPAPEYESKELTPVNAKIIMIDNRTYIELHRDKPYSVEFKRGNGSVKIYGMVFSLDLPKIRIEDMSKYKICNGNEILILVNFDNASYIKVSGDLRAVGKRYMNIFGMDIYVPDEPVFLTRCKFSVNISKNEKGKWIKIPAMYS
jgi:uncharacterized ubiquitin-like protein YukD